MNRFVGFFAFRSKFGVSRNQSAGEDHQRYMFGDRIA